MKPRWPISKGVIMLQVEVLSVRPTRGGLKIAHVRAGEFFGDVPATGDVIEGAAAHLRVTLVCRDGRLGASLRCEREKA